MAKTWILDTETKGTGAHMVPLEKALKGSPREEDLALVEFVRPLRARESSEEAALAEPLTFKVVDVRSSHVLGDSIDARATVDLLEGISSVVDVRIYVRPSRSERWRLLTLQEQKTLWGFRGQARARDQTAEAPAA